MTSAYFFGWDYTTNKTEKLHDNQWIERPIFLQNESIRVDSHNESNRFESWIGMLYCVVVACVKRRRALYCLLSTLAERHVHRGYCNRRESCAQKTDWWAGTSASSLIRRCSGDYKHAVMTAAMTRDQGCSPKKKWGTPETRLRQRFTVT